MAASIDPPGGPASGPGSHAVDSPAQSEFAEQPAAAVEPAEKTENAGPVASVAEPGRPVSGIESGPASDPISVLSARLEAGQISLEGAIDDLVARLSGQLDGPDTTGLRAELTELLHSLIATDPYLAQLAAQIEQARPVDAPRAGDRPRDAFDRRGNDP
ncbi:MAG: hypothetical protein MJE77_26515 [Proteobacteria bacterium]|nr:hypothetical protein [Pseudomonadota bacterium]